MGPHRQPGKVSLAAAWLFEGEEREGRWSREGPECQAEGQVLLQRQGPGINTHWSQAWVGWSHHFLFRPLAEKGIWSWLRKQEGHGN